MTGGRSKSEEDSTCGVSLMLLPEPATGCSQGHCRCHVTIRYVKNGREGGEGKGEGRDGGSLAEK